MFLRRAMPANATANNGAIYYNKFIVIFTIITF